MQSTPIRLSQTIWSAFQAARPIHQPAFYRQLQRPLTAPGHPRSSFQIWQKQTQLQQKCFYSGNRKDQSIEEKVADAKDRIQESLESRAQAVEDAEATLKQPQDETIVHTLPESSSIVHTRKSPSLQDIAQDATSRSSSEASEQPTHFASNSSSSALPSQLAALRSTMSHRFSHFMDSMQSQIFVASKRINDLTGYTGIERLKRQIEAQEDQLQENRQLVKTNRKKYAEAIETRSATQREVNDLLHRKHAWSPQDLERFTGLYRSDHANEQAEQKAHQQLSEAEVRYEEASTKLAKSILARYHEEQIWSDKIRQMSTWGTWGLMGLNVLLFLLLQIAIEPWRRKRLVRGFEDKVEAALSARDQEIETLQAHLRTRDGNQVIQEAVASKSEGTVVAAGEQLAEAVIDAITGATDSSASTSGASATTDAIEATADQMTNTELSQETRNVNTAASTMTTQPLGATSSASETKPSISSTSNDADANAENQSRLAATTQDAQPSSSSPSSSQSILSTLRSIPKTLSEQYTHYTTMFLSQFNQTDHVLLSRLELTTRVTEGIAFGALLTYSVIFMLGRAR